MASDMRSFLKILETKKSVKDMETRFWQTLASFVNTQYVNPRFLGSGGEGFVIEVFHEALDKKLALKVFRPSVLEERFAKIKVRDSDVKHRIFNRAVKIQSKLAAAIDRRIAKIPHIYDVRATHDCYITMEYLPGRDLYSYCIGQQSARIRLLVLLRILDAVKFIHANQIVHSDLKPDNVHVCEKGIPSILDWGLCKNMRDKTEFTKTGEVLGSPLWMPPEQLEDASNRDKRSDIYACGGLLYVCMAQHAPQWIAKDENEEVIIRHYELERLPEPFRRVFKKATQEEKHMRHQCITELIDDIKRAAAYCGITKQQKRNAAAVTAEHKIIVRDPSEGNKLKQAAQAWIKFNEACYDLLRAKQDAKK